MFIVVEGAPGSGKSTFIKSVKLNVKKVYEKVPIETLKRYLSNINSKEETLKFQKIMFTQKMMEMFEAENSQTTTLIDRGIIGDRAFVLKHYKNGMLDIDLWNQFESYWNDILREIKNYKTIYLRCSPETCIKRCRKRDRDGEAVYDLNYFKDICKVHDDIFLNRKDVLVVDWNTEFDDKMIEYYATRIFIKAFFEKKIVVEGNIGAGKTTFIEHFASWLREYDFKVFVSHESKNGLDEFLENMDNPEIVTKYQMNKRIERYNSISYDYTGFDFVIFDRSLIGDDVFAQIGIERGLIFMPKWTEFARNYKFNGDFSVIYINTNHQVCMERCILRDGTDSSSYDLSYFKRLDKLYKSHIPKTSHIFNFSKKMKNREIKKTISNSLFQMLTKNEF